MNTTTFKMIGAGVVLAAAIASSAFAHKPEHEGMGMMGEHMETMAA